MEALDRLNFYLTDAKSGVLSVLQVYFPFGVAERSVLGPLYCTLYAPQLSHVISGHQFLIISMLSAVCVLCIK